MDSIAFYNKWPQLTAFSFGRLCDFVSIFELLGLADFTAASLKVDLQAVLAAARPPGSSALASTQAAGFSKSLPLTYGEKCPDCGQQLRVLPICIPMGKGNTFGYKSHILCDWCLYERYSLSSLSAEIESYRAKASKNGGS